MDKLCEKCEKDCKQNICVVAHCPNYAPNFNDSGSNEKAYEET